MAVLPIVTWPDARLTTPCQPTVLGQGLRDLAADMLETMYAAPGRGLAAPQVGVLLRLFVMDTGWREGRPNPQVMVNPSISWRSEAVATGPEGCLSIPGILTLVSRAKEIDLEWTALDGTPQRARMTGFDAVCAQHEYDHLDGIVTFDRLSPEDQAVAMAAYQP